MISDRGNSILPIQKEETLLVEKKAKKYKKLFEKVAVNRNPVAINGKNYYQIVYMNRQGETKGGAIISPKEEVESEVHDIHFTLSVYNALILSFYDGGIERANVPDKYFTLPLRMMEESSSTELEEGKEKIARLYELHLEHKRVFQETLARMRSTFVVTASDLKYVMETAAALDLVHFEMLEIMTRDIPVIKDWVERMKLSGLWKQLDRETQRFYEYMIKDIHVTKKNLSTKPPLVGSTKEEVMANKLKVSWEHNEKMEKNYRKRLRWPKPW
ncbi:hypothetical protein KP77_01670 [Jeotgalibacillus alimentarius]|uniref:Uncharacterized protein n=1 Tax=Jeotgalibacillus alimentarius TaxID=135826 RepID=A0A0C2VXV1_9BACL|nr:hypothetical protein [Jeotgalibacillus alimentarius]KIL53672.1 hypothetical protein KP77_01670 [Jeotgalibacillus alimentarius]